MVVLRVIEKEIINFFKGRPKLFFDRWPSKILFRRILYQHLLRVLTLKKSQFFFVVYSAVVCRDDVACQTSSKDQQLGK